MAFNEDDDITEMKSLEVDRVDAVGSPANGTGWLVLKAGDPNTVAPAPAVGGVGTVGGAGIVGYTVAGGGSSTFTTGDISVGGRYGYASVGAQTAVKAKYSAEQLRALYKQGHAMKGPNGQIDYPIADEEDLHNAIHAVGRGGASHDKIRRYIKRRAKALGHADLIPDTWTSAGASKDQQEGGWRMSKHATKKAAPPVPADQMPATHDAAPASDPIGQAHIAVPDGGPTAEADGAPHSSPTTSAAAALPTDGDSSSLGGQTTDPDALEGQTMENCTPPAGGPTQPEMPTQKASKKGKKKRHMHNPQHPDTAADVADADDATKATGDTQWQATDVSLGQTTIDHLRQALASAQEFTHREKTEAEDAAATKEIHMTQDELVRFAALIGEAAKKDKADRKAAKKAKADRKAAKRLGELETRLETVEQQPARNRPVLSGASGPSGDTAFKELQDRLDTAKSRGDTGAALRAAKQLSTARLIAIETARRDGRLPQPAGLPDNATPILTGTHLLPADPRIRGI